MRYQHVDVFASRPYSGNSLAVFPDAGSLTGDQMSRITKELRHFESIFLAEEGDVWRARVFDLMEELDFAGHPVIGAACSLHALHGTAVEEKWTMRLNARTVLVTTRRLSERRFTSVLDQGPAHSLGVPDPTGIANWFSLDPADLDPQMPPEVISTGLRYLVVPVRGDALQRARVSADISAQLATMNAQFAYLLDAGRMEARHWNNDGVTEDVATGSGAGCAAAYLRRHDRIGDGEPVVLRQGRFTGRPSLMAITAHGSGERIHSVRVGGDVVLIGEGALRELPE